MKFGLDASSCIVIPTAPELIHGASSSGHKSGDRGYDDGADVAYP